MKRVVSTKNKIVLYNIFSLFILAIFLFPLYWALISSFKLDGEIFSNPPTLWPKFFTITAYAAQLPVITRPFINSTVIACSSMLLTLLLAIPSAYGLSRYRVPGLRLFLVIFLITQMLPPSLVLTPLYLIFSKMKLLNNYLAPILATATVSIPFVVLLLRPIFLHTPKELEDSARIDGCNTVTAFLRIIMPISKPGILTAACFGFVMSWNDLAYSMTFNSKAVMRPLTAGIYQFMNQYGTQWNKIMAYGIIVILPPCILFVAMQKHIIGGLVGGSVKG